MSLSFVLRAIAAFYAANFQAVVVTTIYLHRGLTHNAVKYPRWLEAVFKFIIWTHTSIFSKDWVGVHRHHHAYADVEGDPHSPWIFGFYTVQFWNVALYGEATKDRAMVERHTRGIPYTRMDKLFFRKGMLGLGVGVGLYYLAFGLGGAIGFLASGIVYVFVQSSTVNGLGHYPSWIGYQNYKAEYAKKAYNLRIGLAKLLVPWGIGGEELHNNHHGDARSAFFAHFRGESDFGGMVIRVLVWLRLATVVYEPKVWKRAA